MTHSLSQSLLDDYLDGDLPEEARREVEQLLEQNPECLQDLQSSRQLKAFLKEFRSPEPPEDYWSELRDIIAARTVEQEETPERSSPLSSRDEIRRSFFRSVVSVAAALALFGSALLLGNSGPVQVRQNDARPGVNGSLPELVSQANTQEDLLFTDAQQRRLSAGMVLVGPAGLLGRFSGLTGIDSFE